MRIVFHIGAGKSGSSAIQATLAQNRVKLAAAGILIPPTDLSPKGPTSGNQVFAFEQLKGPEPSKAAAQFAALFEPLVAEAEQEAMHTVIFSAENLSNPFEWGPVLSPALEGHTIETILYVRRQDEYLLSAWQQWGLKINVSFDEWLLRHLGKTADWSIPIKQWRNVGSNAREHVRVFSRDLLINGDVVADFCETLGFADLDLVYSGNVNQSYGIAAEELMLDAAEVFDGPHDNRFARFLDRVGQGGHTKQEGESRLSTLERQLILNHYADSNEWIRQNCFPPEESLPPRLFALPPESGAMPSDTELLHKKLGLIVELIFGEHLDRIEVNDANG